MTAIDAPSGGDGAAADFQLGIAGVVALLIRRLEESQDRRWFRNDEELEDRFPFLEEYRAALIARAGGDRRAAQDPAHWAAASEELARSSPEHLPLHALVGAPFSGPEVRTIVTAVALAERDVRLGSIFATVQAPLNSRRPCIGLLGWLLGDAHQLSDVAARCAALVDAGVLSIDNPDDPQAEQLLRLPAPVLAGLEGAPIRLPGVEVRDITDVPALTDLVLPPALTEQLSRLPGVLGNGGADLVVWRGMTGTGRRTVAHAVARACGRGILLADRPGDEAVRVLGALALLTGSMLVHVVAPGLGELLDLPAPPPGIGPVGVVCGLTGGVRMPGSGRVLVMDVPAPDPDARRQLWERTGLQASPLLLQDLAERFALTGGHIHRVAATAAAVAALADRNEPEVLDVREAARTLGRSALDTLTTPLRPLTADLRPVLTGDTRAEFEALVLRCRRREAIIGAVAPGLGASLNRGVRTMFSGPSGTGKTLAARALGAELDLDVYRVDLAAVVDKYIGETERRLNEVFSRAEELDVVLLLDEGDSLMARRTDVRNANDRYANLETNFLLQRLESYEGIVVVTTNAAAVVDTAFLRRLDVVIAFTPPDVEERRAIWRIHLPEQHAIGVDLLGLVARRCQLTGGQIRNAALHAALVAFEHGGPLDDVALTLAVNREYRRAGLTSPLGPGGPPPPSGHSLLDVGADA